MRNCIENQALLGKPYFLSSCKRANDKEKSVDNNQMEAMTFTSET